MDIMQEFEKYLPKWCEEHHRPLPPNGKINKIWQLAWQDFMNKPLSENWEENKAQYWNMELLTKKEKAKRDMENQKIVDDSTEQDEEHTTPEQHNHWEEVKKLLH